MQNDHDSKSNAKRVHCFYEKITKKEPLKIYLPPYLFGGIDSTKLHPEPERKQENVSRKLKMAKINVLTITTKKPYTTLIAYSLFLCTNSKKLGPPYPSPSPQFIGNKELRETEVLI